MKEANTSIENLVRERPGLAGLFSGQVLSLSPNCRGPCAQSTYARLHLQNAADLLRASYHLDFAVPGALFLLRQGLELWLKCIASNLELDEILALVVRERPSFEELSKQDVITRERSKDVAKKNRHALSRGLCAFRSVHVDGLRAPEIWTKRNQGNFPDQSIQAVADRSDFSRELFGLFYVPLIGGHDLRRLWAVAKANISSRCLAINSYGSLCGCDEQMDLTLLDDLVEVLSRLDPDGDALRYPFSIRQEWHDQMPPMSKPWLEGAIGTTLSQIVNESGERSQRYALSTIGGGVQPWILPS